MVAHIETSFPFGPWSANKAAQAAAMRGPFVYFLPMNQLCSQHPHHPMIQIYQPPAAPGRILGLVKDGPAYMQTMSVGENSALVATAMRMLDTRRYSHDFI